MTKVPEPGLVKTRLRPFLSDDQCAQLSECFLIDSIRKAQLVTQNVIVAYSANGDEASIFDLLPEAMTCIKQHGENLGERLISAADFAEANGCGPIIIIGTDSPTIPIEVFSSSLRELENPATQLVLGGTEDGGYYLIGLKQNIPAIFEGIPWSSDKVYSATLKQAVRIGLTGIVELSKFYDVDTPDDLRRLFAEVKNDINLRSAAPETSRWIAANRALFD